MDLALSLNQRCNSRCRYCCAGGLPSAVGKEQVLERPKGFFRDNGPLPTQATLRMLNHWPGVLRWADQLDKDRCTDN